VGNTFNKGTQKGLHLAKETLEKKYVHTGYSINLAGFYSRLRINPLNHNISAERYLVDYLAHVLREKVE
jgi:hypothetical protein